jgi:hypothetical protein
VARAAAAVDDEAAWLVGLPDPLEAADGLPVTLPEEPLPVPEDAPLLTGVAAEPLLAETTVELTGLIGTTTEDKPAGIEAAPGCVG